MNGTKNGCTWVLGLVVLMIFGGIAEKATAQTGLQVSFGSKGVQKLAYNGVVLEDVGAYPQDAFHIWHMKSTDLSGNVLSTGGYGWGESNYGESWNSQTNTETYTFSWGAIATRFVQNGNNLDLVVTETNSYGSGIIFQGAEIYPLLFHFPREPLNFYGYNQNVITSTGPGVSAADFGAGVVTSVLPGESVPLYGGWKSQGNSTYTPIMTTTAPDGLAPFLPRNDVPVQPGSSLTYTLSLRFTPEGSAADASDAYASFAATYPNRMTWTDKRIIGTAYLASSPSNADITQPGGFPTNPRRYFNDPSVDITTVSGLQSFQNRMLAQASNNVSTTGALNGQGVVTWDIEGEQYPQATSYVCSPEQIATVAPEMESTVLDTHSAYYGRKLDDAYFETMSSAGLRIGLCLRPQVFTFGAHGTASQAFLTTNLQIIANLEAKANYANRRWGATIFYVDSTVDSTGGTLDPAVFQQLITDFPNFLFIPEESTPRYYAYTAPFYSFIFQTSLGTSASAYKVYPNAFGANLVNDVSAGTLGTYTPQLTDSVRRGDILMGHGDYWQANDPTLVSIYQSAGSGNGGRLPVAPSVAWGGPAAIPYGTPLSATQLNASSVVAGTFVYSPAAGTVLNAGTNTLLTTFTPTDQVNYKAATASTTVVVTPGVPSVQWPSPYSVVYGTALSATQLNATAGVPGTFVYTPAAGTTLPSGNNSLTVVFTPTSQNYASVSASANLTVTQAPSTSPALSWAPPASVSYGTPLGIAQLNATASVPGTLTYSPAAGAVLPAGVTTLLVTFTPQDAVNYRSVSASSSLTVTQAVPAVQWAAPASIVYGTALSGSQLSASANVAGTFAYTPAAGTVLNGGPSTLQLTFTPTDRNDYKPVSTSVPLTVLPAAPAVTWLAPAPITYGTALSGAQLNASANVAGVFSYTPGVGTILPVGNSVLNVTFTPTNAANYSSAVASTNVGVTQAARTTPSLTWAQPVPISYGTALSSTQLNASAGVLGTFTYNPGFGSVLTAGISALGVTFTPADGTKYNTASTTVNLSVTRATPLVTWAPPSAITAGTALSGAQLNAGANVPGTFAYAPGQGAVLNVGTTMLAATFTPFDTANYTSQTASVALSVVAPPPNAYVWIVSPGSGQTVSGTINVTAGMRLYLDAAGSFLIVDGQYLSDVRSWGPAYSYALDTTKLSNGPHTVRVWAHDISNNVNVSTPIIINVMNPVQQSRSKIDAVLSTSSMRMTAAGRR